MSERLDVMTVAELIELLQEQDPTWEVNTLLTSGGYGELIDVRVDDGAERVTLVGG